MAVTRDTTPFILSGETHLALTAGVPGGAAQLPVKSLVNPLSVPVEISEIMVTTQIVGTGFTVGVLPLRLRLRAGRHGLTNGFVPAFALGPMYSETQGEPIFTDLGGTTFGGYTSRWVLPRPMVLRPGEVIGGEVDFSPKFSYPGLAGTVYVSITAKGRRMPPGAAPALSNYPFVSGDYFTTAGGPVQDLTFQNVFPAPLTVTALIAVRGGIVDSAQILPGVASPGAPVGAVSIIGPSGLGGGARRTLAEGAAALLFGPRAALEESFTLDPNESLLVKLTAPVTQAAAITLVGYREEAA